MCSSRRVSQNVRYCSFSVGSSEPALAPVDRRPPCHHAEPSLDGQEGELGPRQSHQLLHGAGLDNRANDISNLLDGIGNGVQILQQARNTGITSLQSLVDSAKSIANQALQTTVGYTTKSNVSATIAGATSSDLRGTTTYTSASALSNVVPNGTAGWRFPDHECNHVGGVAAALVGTASTAGDGTAKLASTLLLTGTSAATDLTAAAAPRMATFWSSTARPSPSRRALPRLRLRFPPDPASAATSSPWKSATRVSDLGAGTLADVLSAIDLASGVAKTVNSAGAAVITGSTSSINSGTGVLTLDTSTGADLSITGKADLLKELGLTTSVGSGNVNVVKARTTAATTTNNLIQDGSILNVNGHTITFTNAHVPAAAQVPTGSGILNAVQTDGNGNSIVYLQTRPLPIR